MTESWKT